MAITLRADPYTLVIIPEIRGPLTYQPRHGFNISVGQLSKVDYAEVIARRYSGFAPGVSGGVKFFVTSGSGNIVTLEVWPGNLPVGFSGLALSHVAFGLKAYGH